MKKKVLALLIAVCVAAVGVPSLAMAEGSSSQEIEVIFTAGSPGSFDMVDTWVEAQGNLAELFFPEIKANEPSEVSFADVLVAAHIKKYGVSKVKDYLDISDGAYGTQVNKQFGHSTCGIYYADNKALEGTVSTEVKAGQNLYAGACNGDWDILYSYFKDTYYTVKAGKEITLELTADDWGKAVVPETANIAMVDTFSGKCKELSVKTDTTGKAALKLKTPGEYCFTANGKAESFGAKVSIAGAFARVYVGLGKTKITKAKTGKKKAALNWKKVTGAKKYQVFRATKKAGKFKKIATVSKLKYTDKKVKSNKKYYYRVCAFAKVKGTSYTGDFSAAKAVKVK